MEDIRLYDMTLPTKLADELEHLSCVLKISRGEVMSRALRLLSLAVDSDKVILTKDNKTQNVIVK